MASPGRPSGTGEASGRTPLSPGDLLAGKFRIERVLGRGGMGVVVEATNVQLDQRVALKLLHTGADDPPTVERFSREARAAARLRSEHVARVYDVGKDTLHGPFIVMEMLEGKTLAEVIKAGRVALHRATEYIIDACEGLAEAHVRGIVHQDVKPANLFLVTGADGRPTIKLLDFGIATMRSKDREADAKSSHPSAGTPAYLSPEQLRGSQPIDHRADIWALGCVLYELIVGERAFRAIRFTELVTSILEAPPHPLPEDLEIPAPLAAVIARCLERDPAKRFTSTGELALALLPLARRRAHAAVSRAVAQVKTGGLDPHLDMPSSMPPPPDSRADFPSSVNLRAPSVPSFAVEPSSTKTAGRATTSGNLSVTSATPAARTRRGEIALVAVVLLLLVGGLIVWLRAPATVARDNTPASTTASAVQAKLAAAPPASTSLASPEPSISSTEPAVASVTTTASAPSASAISSSSTPRAHGFPGSNRPIARPSASSAPPAPPPTRANDSDIRLTR